MKVEYGLNQVELRVPTAMAYIHDESEYLPSPGRVPLE